MKTNFGYAMILFIMVACTSNDHSNVSQKEINSEIEIVVHRGANRLAPENTMAAFYLAIEHGADYIEIDLATSKDNVLYCFHDKTLERTTDGSGIFSEQSSSYINTLDAGSWFSPEFAGEPVPRVDEIIKKLKGKVKFYFDVKNVDLDQFIAFLEEENLQEQCFVWFSDRDMSKKFQELAPQVQVKMNAVSTEEINQLLKEYRPTIIECDAANIDDAIQKACEVNDLRLMANLLRDSWWEYKHTIKAGVDMVNIDHPDYFSQMVEHPENKFSNHRLIAHRGGIVEGVFDEFDPRSIESAIDSGYWMLEVDVRPTADKHIVLHHDKDLKSVYGVNKLVSEMTLSELKNLRAKKGNYSPITLAELADICQGRVRLMMDIKPDKPEPWFCDSINHILEKYNLAEKVWFIRNDIREYFPKGKFGFRMNEAWEMKERMENGEDIVARYYLFDHGNRINAEVARWCQLHNIDICASVNIGHYRMEDDYMGAKRDIEHLVKCGVTAFQIDSDYDDFFRDLSLARASFIW